MLQAVLTSPTGVRSHIGWVIEVLIDYSLEDFYGSQISREIVRLGAKLAMAGGPMAPAVVLVAIEPRFSKGYANHIAALWRLDEIDEADMDPADMPSLAISGEPPGRRAAV